MVLTQRAKVSHDATASARAERILRRNAGSGVGNGIDIRSFPAIQIVPLINAALTRAGIRTAQCADIPKRPRCSAIGMCERRYPGKSTDRDPC